MRHQKALIPVDAWFFRDSRPYNQGESYQTDAKSIFPPFAPTVVGALRAGLARSRGWDGRSKWGTDLTSVLGDGFEDLGELDFGGPYILRHDGEDWERLYPAPLHLLGHSVEDESKPDDLAWIPAARLRPGKEEEAVLTDLGDGARRARLPELHPEDQRKIDASGEQTGGLGGPQDVWLTRAGFEDALAGKLPDAEEVVLAKELWRSEPRVGLAREEGSRTAKEGNLYSPTYVRLHDHTALGVRVDIDGVSDEQQWSIPERLVLGGEHRMASVEPADFAAAAGGPAGLQGATTLTVTFVTPARFRKDTLDEKMQPGATLDDRFGPLQGATLVSACVDKPVHIGGWNSVKHRPLDLKAYLPPGTTWFVDISTAEIDDPAELQGEKIGRRTAYGFGEMAIGIWND